MRGAALVVRRGPLAMQGKEAARGLTIWACLDGVDLELVDDPSPDSVAETYYRRLRSEQIDLVLGSYGSDLVRRTLPAVGREGKVLCNHGGSADDLVRSGVVQVVASASTSLVGRSGSARLGIAPRLVIVTEKGPFSAFVAKGARDEAQRFGYRHRARHRCRPGRYG